MDVDKDLSALAENAENLDLEFLLKVTGILTAIVMMLFFPQAIVKVFTNPMDSLEAARQKFAGGDRLFVEQSTGQPASANGDINDPRVRAMLDTIAEAEGTYRAGEQGYFMLFGKTFFEGCTKHPDIRKRFRETTGRINETTAAGRYQYLTSTWETVRRANNLPDFCKNSQDIGAKWLLGQRGALKYILSMTLDEIYANDTQKQRYLEQISKAFYAARKEWASLPDSPHPQPRRGRAELLKFFEQKLDFYSGKTP